MGREHATKPTGDESPSSGAAQSPMMSKGNRSLASSSKPARAESPSLPRSEGGDALMGTCIDCYLPGDVYAMIRGAKHADDRFMLLLKSLVESIESNKLSLPSPLPQVMKELAGTTNSAELISRMKQQS